MSISVQSVLRLIFLITTAILLQSAFFLQTYCQKIVPEAKSILIVSKGSTYKGKITLKSTDDGCRSMNLDVDVSITSKKGVTDFELFYPGIEFEFTNDCCLPARKTPYTKRQSVQFEASGGMGFEEGELVSRGPIEATGRISLVVDKSKPVFEISTSLDEPLVLILTKRGFEYVSGRGSVKVPSGKLYEFGKTKSSKTKLPPETEEERILRELPKEMEREPTNEEIEKADRIGYMYYWVVNKSILVKKQ